MAFGMAARGNEGSHRALEYKVVVKRVEVLEDGRELTE